MKRYLFGAVALVVLGATAATAADVPMKAPVYKAPPPPPAWVWEVGARYWYSSGKNGFNYYNDATTAQLNSRLTYDKLTAHSGEAFFRVDSPFNIFLKGYIGGGKIVGGNLFDEDFPPLEVPYSKTISDTKGNLDYANIDVGYTLYDGRGKGTGLTARFGPFVGFHYWHEKVDALGCAQVSGGTICAGGASPPEPTSTKIISEEDKWSAFRVGAVADVWFTRELKLTAEAAYARVWLRTVDTHYFNVDIGVDPSSGDRDGFHLESVLAYQITDNFNVGVGGRWWHYNTDTIDRYNQLLKYTTDRYGVFVQGSVKFGEPLVRIRN